MADPGSQNGDEAARLRANYDELAELSGSLAHEIKNPLSVIRMNMDLLAEDTTSGAGTLRARTRGGQHRAWLGSLRERRVERRVRGGEIEILHERAGLPRAMFAVHASIFPFDR